jgi:hypothetical protein
MLTFFPQERHLYTEDITSWFADKYRQLCRQYKFKPTMVLNLDETMVRVLKSHVKLVTRRDDPQPSFDYGAKEPEHVSLLSTISAGGQVMKPLFIFPLKYVPHFPRDLKDSLDKRVGGWTNAFSIMS